MAEKTKVELRAGSGKRSVTRLAAAVRWVLPVVVGGLPGVGIAAEYSAQYGVEAGYEYNDNVRFLTEDEIDISGSRAALPVSFGINTERLQAALEGELVSSKFDREEYDSDDQELNGKVSYKFERGELEGHLGVERDSTRDSEFLDTGEVGLSATRREQFLGGFSGMQMFTETVGFSAAGDYEDVDYDGIDYQPYRYGTGHVGLVFQGSERTLYRLQAYGSTFESDVRQETKTDGVGGQLGIETRFSEQLSLTLLGGWVQLESEYRGAPLGAFADSDDEQLLLDVQLQYELERSRLRLRASSMPRPSASGFLLATDQLEFSYRYDLSERSRIDLNLSASQRDAIDDQFQNQRDYARARLRMDYRFTESWYLTADYIYSYQDREQQEGTADSNAVIVGLKYQPRKSKWSR